MNYFVYTDDQGVAWSTRMTAETATFVAAVLAPIPLPRVPGKIMTRKLRLANSVTGYELLIKAPYAWPYPIGELVAFKGSFWFVTEQLPEAYRFEKG